MFTKIREKKDCKYNNEHSDQRTFEPLSLSKQMNLRGTEPTDNPYAPA